jgi:hypothetical protein
MMCRIRCGGDMRSGWEHITPHKVVANYTQSPDWKHGSIMNTIVLVIVITIIIIIITAIIIVVSIRSIFGAY